MALWVRMQLVNHFDIYALILNIIPSGIEPEESGTYECLLENLAGSTREEFDVKVRRPPGVPTKLRVTSILKDSVTLAWDSPEVDGGLPVSGYVVEKRDARKGGWTTAGTVDGRSHSFRVSRFFL